MKSGSVAVVEVNGNDEVLRFLDRRWYPRFDWSDLAFEEVLDVVEFSVEGEVKGLKMGGDGKKESFDEVSLSNAKVLEELVVTSFRDEEGGSVFHLDSVVCGIRFLPLVAKIVCERSTTVDLALNDPVVKEGVTWRLARVSSSDVREGHPGEREVMKVGKLGWSEVDEEVVISITTESPVLPERFLDLLDVVGNESLSAEREGPDESSKLGRSILLGVKKSILGGELRETKSEGREMVTDFHTKGRAS